MSHAAIATSVGLIAAVVCAAPACAQSAAAFYNDRQVTILIGSAPGGGYDLFGRMFARHMGKHLPGGNARFVVKNMPGAGGLAAVNHTFNVADRDGSVIATVARDSLFDPFISGDAGQAKFDPRRFAWLGTPNVEVGMIYVSTASGVRTVKDAQQRDVTLGTAGSSRSPAVVLPKVLNELIGTKFKVISGYQGSMEAIVAMERGEVEGRYSPGWSGPEPNKIHDLIAAGQARLLAYISPDTSPAHKDLVNVVDFTRSAEDRQLLQLLIAAQGLGRPFFAPPDIPADRVAALQAAFARTLQDRDFLEEAAKHRFDIGPTLGPAMADYVNAVLATPAPLVKRAADLLNRAARN